MTNLLAETLRELAYSKKTPDDVAFVTDGEGYCRWQDFAARAATYDYDSGYGLVYVNLHLRVVGNDWWLEREEHDGSEEWMFKTLPTRPDHFTDTLQIAE